MLSKLFYERAWNIADELAELNRQMSANLAELSRLTEQMGKRREEMQRPKPLDFTSMNYSPEKLLDSVKKLEYSDEHVKFVEEKLGVTKEGECEAKIKAMSTEKFIRFYKKVTEEWETRKRKYPQRTRKKVAG